jgi:ATP-dependent DNA helicase RecG
LNTKLSPSNTNKELSWDSTISQLYSPKRVSQSATKLMEAGLIHLRDLLWLFPHKIYIRPKLKSFEHVTEGHEFKGRGKILGVISRPNFRAKGKRGVLLQNIDVTLQDFFSNKTLKLKWFNTYPSVVEKLKRMQLIEFEGKASQHLGGLQIANPTFHAIEEIEEVTQEPDQLRIIYPTIAGVKSTHIQGIINKIPQSLWDCIDDDLPDEMLVKRQLMKLNAAFQLAHGKSLPHYKWQPELHKKAMDRLIYQEFFREQLKVHLRRSKIQSEPAPKLSLTDIEIKNINKLFPYEFTPDQTKVLEEVQNDLLRGHPMMRLVQGDVGCGKTTVALVSCLFAIKNKFQAAIMAPTEGLARQHFENASLLFGPNSRTKVALLLGSTPAKEKREINQGLADGSIHFIIGTHSLIQKDVTFQKLGMVIVDEQHKFGVEQRISLTSKGQGTHCLIMTATPIPRSLSLTQYGDLEISTIKTMPSGRKPIRSKVVRPKDFQNYLSFMYTRLKLGEQGFIVVPAIEEKENQDFVAVEQIHHQFQKYFKDFIVRPLHGKFRPQEKKEVLEDFRQKKIQLLVSTSVVEVGIDIPNATMMSVMNPERFGLSSLHQLRGRVGRGGKPGFFFMVLDEKKGHLDLKRLKVMEQTTDGFKIAEEDLNIRGEGDLFGTQQSGDFVARKVANIIKHQDWLFKAREDAQHLIEQNHSVIHKTLAELADDKKIFTTI